VVHALDTKGVDARGDLVVIAPLAGVGGAVEARGGGYRERLGKRSGRADEFVVVQANGHDVLGRMCRHDTEQVSSRSWGVTVQLDLRHQPQVIRWRGHRAPSAARIREASRSAAVLMTPPREPLNFAVMCSSTLSGSYRVPDSSAQDGIVLITASLFPS
jgi:hypothetical protein